MRLQCTALLILLVGLTGAACDSNFDNTRLEEKRELNGDVDNAWNRQRQTGSTLAELLRSGTNRNAVYETEQNLNDSMLPKIVNETVNKHVDENNVFEHSETQRKSVKGHATQLVLDHDNDGCRLKVADKSVVDFYNRILYNNVRAVKFNLTSTQFNITSKNGTILPNVWIWVYQQTLTLLNMPPTASMWSLGLLAFYNEKAILEVEIQPENARSCKGIKLEIGNPVNDQMIGQALGNMMRGLAMKYLQYNTSNWCYRNTTDEFNSGLLQAMNNNFFSVSPIVQFVCCAYDLERDFNMNVACQNVHVYDNVWWGVPLGLGILMWLYFPLLFMYVNGKVHKAILKSSIANDEVDTRCINGEGVVNASDLNDGNKQSTIFNDSYSPITIFSMIKHPLSKLLPRKQKNKSRIAIFMYTIFTLILPGLEVLVHYIFYFDYIQSLANKNISLGFSSVLGGWDKSREAKLSVFGGPIIAVCLYLIVSWILLLPPKVMAHQIYRGVCDGKEPTKSILFISLKKKEELGSTEIRKVTNGYLRLTKLQICHLLMLINPDYWVFTATLIKQRYCMFASALKSRLQVPSLRLICLCLCFPFYAIFCLIEIILGFLYFICPMFSFLFCVTIGASLGLSKYVSVKIVPRLPRLGSFLRYPACLVVVLMFMLYWYIFTIIFIDSFFFVSRTILFTYTAVVAYPRETYGYFMLVFLSIYFGFKGFFQFGHIYKMILKQTIKLCKKDEILKNVVEHHQEPDGNETFGVPRELFEYLVERIRPRRVHVLYTIIRFVIMVFILSISIILIQRFDKFDDMSLLVHVFITIFICALPNIYQSMVTKESIKRQMTRKLKKHLRYWVLTRMTSIQTHTGE